MEAKEMEKDKVIIDDPRAIYALSMVVILYELYNKLNPDIFVNQDKTLFNTLLTSLISPLKFIFSLLILMQFLFLLVRGLSLADVNDNHKKYLLYFSDRIYASGFQLSLVILPIIGASIAILSMIFDYLKIPIKLWIVILFFLLSVAPAVYYWKIWFWNSNAAYVALQTPPEHYIHMSRRASNRRWLRNNFTNIYVCIFVVMLTLSMIYYFSKSVKLF